MTLLYKNYLKFYLYNAFINGINTYYDDEHYHPIPLTIPPPDLQHVDQLPNVAAFNDAQHRGPNWYVDTSHLESSGLDINETSESSIEETSRLGQSYSISSSASSYETDEKKKSIRVYRQCTPCPHDMLKHYKNLGIKWICAGYQRARRSFKSDCMMRYRNCEDGTMFVKIYDHRCRNDTFHGKHFFYNYQLYNDKTV